MLYEDLGNTLGFYNTYKRIKFIHINNQIDETTQRFVCAHELGHAVLHPKANTPFLRNQTFFSVDRLEIEANTFAVELLLTDEMITAYEDTRLTIQEVAEIYGVPGGFARLKTINIQVRSYINENILIFIIRNSNYSYCCFINYITSIPI